MAPVSYTGALMPKKKSELQDIAVALRISDQGTKDELHARIKKHLDNNPSLEDNPLFAGLYGRRKRSAQPQPPPQGHAPLPSTRFAPSIEFGSEQPRLSGNRVTVLDPIQESTPVKDLRDVSTFLKHPRSPVDSTPSHSPRQALDTATASSLPPLPPSPAKSLIKHIPKPADVRTVVQRIQRQEILPSGVEFVEATRAFLSNSRNIWTLTALFELIYILQTVIPWKTAQLPLLAKGNGFSLSVPYTPLSVFQASAFWMVLLHWSIPTLIIPSFVGTLISFNPTIKPAQSQLDETRESVAPFDPLTAAIIRLAVSIAYPYAIFASKEHIFGLDVLGFNLRVLNAAVGLAFAFAEAIAGAPQLFAKSLVREQRLLIAPADQDSIRIPRRALTADDDAFGAEVD